ncbi:MAG: type II secretion system F family protein [Candidatus Nanohaloarchaeota archaeon QJJ-7]|nr:type II secretion system F family protein [Candidatus Nanohaloarchaeota archaeon QJJ-7]
MHLLERLASILPQSYLDSIEKQAYYAHFPGYRDTTSLILVIGTLAILATAFLLPVSNAIRALVALGGFVIVAAFPYILFSLMAERRRRAIENVLPDALLLISANIESGLTVDKAFLVSARDEFGPLADDIRLTAMKMFGGMPVEEALDELAESTNSELFEETLKLLVDGISSGGEVSSLLESSANDIRTSLQLREEIATNVRMYSMFIMIAAVVGAPLLFGVSTYLTETTSQLWASADVGGVPSQGFVSLSEPEIDIEFFRQFAMAAIAITNIFAALLMSEIKRGSMKEGLKKVPLFVIVSLGIFYASLKVIVIFLG